MAEGEGASALGPAVPQSLSSPPHPAPPAPAAPHCHAAAPGPAAAKADARARASCPLAPPLAPPAATWDGGAAPPSPCAAPATPHPCRAPPLRATATRTATAHGLKTAMRRTMPRAGGAWRSPSSLACGETNPPPPRAPLTHRAS